MNQQNCLLNRVNRVVIRVLKWINRVVIRYSKLRSDKHNRSSSCVLIYTLILFQLFLFRLIITWLMISWYNVIRTHIVTWPVRTDITWKQGGIETHVITKQILFHLFLFRLIITRLMSPGTKWSPHILSHGQSRSWFEMDAIPAHHVTCDLHHVI